MPRCSKVQRCRMCGCTDDDCRQCIRRTGEPCHWVEPDLCSACVPGLLKATAKRAVKHLDEWAESLRLGHVCHDGTWEKKDRAVHRQYKRIKRDADILRKYVH